MTLARAVDEAIAREDAGQVDDFGHEWASRYYRRRRVLLRTCQVLAARWEDGTFPLAQAALGEALGLRQRTVSSMLRWAVEERFLIIIEEHDHDDHRARHYALGQRLIRDPDDDDRRRRGGRLVVLADWRPVA